MSWFVFWRVHILRFCPYPVANKMLRITLILGKSNAGKFIWRYFFHFLEIDFWIGNKFFTEKVIRKISFYINNHTCMFMYGWMSHWMNVTGLGGVRECDRTLENWNYLNIHRKVTRFRHRAPPPPPNKTKTIFFLE